MKSLGCARVWCVRVLEGYFADLPHFGSGSRFITRLVSVAWRDSNPPNHQAKGTPSFFLVSTEREQASELGTGRRKAETPNVLVPKLIRFTAVVAGKRTCPPKRVTFFFFQQPCCPASAPCVVLEERRKKSLKIRTSFSETSLIGRACVLSIACF